MYSPQKKQKQKNNKWIRRFAHICYQSHDAARSLRGKAEVVSCEDNAFVPQGEREQETGCAWAGGVEGGKNANYAFFLFVYLLNFQDTLLPLAQSHVLCVCLWSPLFPCTQGPPFPPRRVNSFPNPFFKIDNKRRKKKIHEGENNVHFFASVE